LAGACVSHCSRRQTTTATSTAQRDLAPQDRAPILHSFTEISILQADFKSAKACASRGAPPGTCLAKRLEHWLLTFFA
jgi:hypothetical protein